VNYYCNIETCSLVFFNITQQSNETNFKEIRIPTTLSNFQTLTKTYQIGTEHECFYDPNIPDKLIFEKPSLWFNVFLTSVLVLCVLFLIFIPIPFYIFCVKLGNPKFLESFQKFNLKLDEFA
jgi:hypothetical protein